jgi:hypothetical protein
MLTVYFQIGVQCVRIVAFFSVLINIASVTVQQSLQAGVQRARCRRRLRNRSGQRYWTFLLCLPASISNAAHESSYVSDVQGRQHELHGAESIVEEEGALQKAIHPLKVLLSVRDESREDIFRSVD